MDVREAIQTIAERLTSEGQVSVVITDNDNCEHDVKVSKINLDGVVFCRDGSGFQFTLHVSEIVSAELVAESVVVP